MQLHVAGVGKWTENEEFLGFGGFSDAKLIRKLPDER